MGLFGRRGRLSSEERHQAIEWITDCVWGDIDSAEEVEALSDAELYDGIERNYDGGFAQFLEDGGLE
jgi:hypothetical protein